MQTTSRALVLALRRAEPTSAFSRGAWQTSDLMSSSTKVPTASILRESKSVSEGRAWFLILGAGCDALGFTDTLALSAFAVAECRSARIGSRATATAITTQLCREGLVQDRS